MFDAVTLNELHLAADLARRHLLFAEAYVEAKRLVRQMHFEDAPWLSVPFLPVHLYMHVLPGFNTYFEPAKYTGWRRLRPIDVDTCPENPRFVRFTFSAAYLGKREW